MLDQIDDIDWKTDWLYQLVFRKVERAWQTCRLDSKAWQYVLVGEWLSAQGSRCGGNLMRGWIRDESGLREISSEEFKQHKRKIHGRIYPFVLVSFHIDANRQQVTIGEHQASTAGAGRRYLVKGEGESAYLVPDPSGGFWVS